jgi:hypothetical protein
MQTAENKTRRGEREEKRRRTRARERREKKEQLRNENAAVAAAHFIIFFWAARAPGRETHRADEWNTTSTTDPTRPDPTRPGQFSAALHNRTEPTFQKTGIVTTVGLKESGGKSDG